jgi:dolichol-phosphate mannosyltransferase
MTAASNPLLVSVVVPLWNEESILDALLNRLTKLAENPVSRWEFIFVDDGSTDATASMLHPRLNSLPKWRFLQLSRNFGQQSAYRAGLDAATGDAVIFLDADLQDPPELIPELISRWKDGAKLVVGCRRSRAESGLRRFLFEGFHRVFEWVTASAMPRDSGTFGLMDRIVVEELKRLPEANLFLPAQRCWVGFRREIIWYDRSVRAGEPKQSLTKLFSYAWDGITSFSVLPLKAISFLGLVISAVGFLYATALVTVKFLQFAGFFPSLVVQGFTTLAVAILCLGGIQLVCLGMIGEYLAKVYKEVKRRPLYIVQNVSAGGENAS